ncbi:MAG: biotin/lipoyl-binding protein, partial [Candidatus Glassbacteria bacterium]
MNLKVLSLSFALVLALLAVAGCGSGDTGENSPQAETVQASVVQVQQAAFPLFTTAVGTVEPYDRANIATRMMGQVKKVHVQEGDRVKKGQAL